MIKTEIRNRIISLGGKLNDPKGRSLFDDLLSIDLKCPLYKRPSAVPWSDNPEPIYGMSQHVEDNLTLYKADKDRFFENMIHFFFDQPTGHYGQTYFTPRLFTPLTQGTDDYEEWHLDFEDDEEVDLSLFKAVASSNPLEFIEITYSNGYPDRLYICASDTEIENPRVFGSDHEVFFSEVSKEGTLEDFFNKFMTKEKLLALVIPQMDAYYQK